MSKAYGYLRVSHTDSAESGLGIAAQRHSVLRYWEYLQDNNRVPDCQWSTEGWCGTKGDGSTTSDGFYIDQAVSAFKRDFSKRPAGAMLARKLQRGDIVIFARFDRAFRTVRDFSNTTTLWGKKGIGIHFVNPQIDLTTAYGRAFAQIAGVFAELESAIKSERNKEVAARLKADGRPVGSKPSVGYRPVTVRGKVTWVLDASCMVVLDDIENMRRNLGMPWGDISDVVEIHMASVEDRPIVPRVSFGDQKRLWGIWRVRSMYQHRERIRAEYAGLAAASAS